jgi:hypothetical protein
MTMADVEGKNLLIVMTTGPEDPEKTYAPFYTAALSAAMEVNTSMYFLMHAPKLLKAGYAEQIKLKKGGTLMQFIKMALEAGVKFYACEESLRSLCEIDPKDVIEGVKVVGSSTLVDLSLDSDTVLSF